VNQGSTHATSKFLDAHGRPPAPGAVVCPSPKKLFCTADVILGNKNFIGFVMSVFGCPKKSLDVGQSTFRSSKRLSDLTTQNAELKSSAHLWAGSGKLTVQVPYGEVVAVVLPRAISL
jgi:hypothetical protein